MRIQEILETKGKHVWSIAQHKTIQEAVEMLALQRIGVLLVMGDDKELAGILSERDIVRQCLHRDSSLGGTVGEIMTREIVSVAPEDDIRRVLAIMSLNNIRHAPVLKDGKIEGLVSIRDIALAQLKESLHENLTLKEYICASRNLMGRKILIADDDPRIFELLKPVFETQQCAVLWAKDGEEGLKAACEYKPDLILVDSLMPKMSGYEMIEKIRERDDEVRNVPVMVLLEKESMKSFFDRLEIAHFFIKPVEAQTLWPEVKKIFGTDADIEIPETSHSMILAGIQDFISDRLREYLSSLGYAVMMAEDENEVIRKASTLSPQFIMVQFWEDSKMLDTVKIHRELQKNPSTKSIPFLVFCSSRIESEALLSDPHADLLVFDESPDLIAKLGIYLKSHL